ncbi:hypothetical protein DERF_013326 [Dermatophagoides farinae]|uniref:Uncharacterized protein n=1 Tax=Dermatophagoides farinae TaxID=6954 RepID=A0A922HPA2_DERFA|nr:hypothetical protein DERF_013326 [Dermatophagoides farinae]
MLSTLHNEHDDHYRLVLIEEFDNNFIGSIDSIVELILIFFALISGLASLRCFGNFFPALNFIFRKS